MRLVSAIARAKLAQRAYSAGPAFGTRPFWTEFYAASERQRGFEWCVDADPSLLETLDGLIPRVGESALLHVGCGSSLLGLHLGNCKGISSVTNVDFCVEVIEHQKKEFAAPNSEPRSAAHQEWIHCDVTALPCEWSARFAAVIDKGTLDALLFAGHDKARLMLSGLDRVLAPGGRLLSITDDPPEHRLEVLLELSRGFHHSYRPIESHSTEWQYYLYMSERVLP